MNYTSLDPVKRGDSWFFSFTWKDQNTPINLTNCTARMQLRDKPTLSMVAEASTNNNLITIDGTNGVVLVEFPPIITNDINPGVYLTDLEITFADTGAVKSSDTVLITVIEDITR